jgi:hypothetical protein
VEKIEKYQDLARELRKLWNTEILVVPVVVGALGTVPKKLNDYPKLIEIRNREETLQKSAILGTARILRNFLEI